MRSFTTRPHLIAMLIAPTEPIWFTVDVRVPVAPDAASDSDPHRRQMAPLSTIAVAVCPPGIVIVTFDCIEMPAVTSKSFVAVVVTDGATADCVLDAPLLPATSKPEAGFWIAKQVYGTFARTVPVNGTLSVPSDVFVYAKIGVIESPAKALTRDVHPVLTGGADEPPAPMKIKMSPDARVGRVTVFVPLGTVPVVALRTVGPATCVLEFVTAVPLNDASATLLDTLTTLPGVYARTPLVSALVTVRLIVKSIVAVPVPLEYESVVAPPVNPVMANPDAPENPLTGAENTSRSVTPSGRIVAEVRVGAVRSAASSPRASGNPPSVSGDSGRFGKYSLFSRPHATAHPVLKNSTFAFADAVCSMILKFPY